jgi:enoyl-CoA hydratase/carnithine racemase/methionyl-tRNA formyltransferase
MKILFLCTAHNSLSQRLYLALSSSHEVTIEYAVSDALMISATELVEPDLVICPFLTSRVPKEIYEKYLTLIIHPGPPGDIGPSALDWVILGDDGTEQDAEKLLTTLDRDTCKAGRTHWGVTVLQAIEEFDAGPVWAFEQFPIDIDQPGLTKSELYRGPVSRAAILATLTAIDRIHDAAFRNQISSPTNVINGRTLSGTKITPHLQAHLDFKLLSVGTGIPFRGGRTFHRPLLKAVQRDFNVKRHTAQQISRRIRCGDSQPGALSKVFGVNLYVYGGIVDGSPGGPNPGAVPGAAPGTIVATRNEAVCIATCDGRGVWITHIRRPKKSTDIALWPKVTAVPGLIELGILTQAQVCKLRWDLPNDWAKSPYPTFQEVWVEFASYGESKQAAYLYFDFYNGAMSTNQCSHLIDAMTYILSTTASNPIQALVLMGGSYFSNGIALNVIEASSSPSLESWLNINRIDDVVHYLLQEFPTRGILTIAGIRGNAAAGGVALATACDIVIAGSEVVLNPAYRALGLHGSEYHSLSYPGRCGAAKAVEILRSMTPLSPFEARSIGLVDHVFPGSGPVLEKRIRNHVAVVVRSGNPGRVLWKSKVDLSPTAIAHARAIELGEMSKDFYSARAVRYHSRRFNFVRKVKPSRTPFRFATHRRFDAECLDDEEKDSFDDVEYYEREHERQILVALQKKLETTHHSVMRPQTPNSVDKGMIGLSVGEKGGVHENLFTCYYEPVERMPTPGLTLSSKSSLAGFSLASTALAA